MFYYVIFYFIKPFAESKFRNGGTIYVAYATWGESFLSRGTLTSRVRQLTS